MTVRNESKPSVIYTEDEDTEDEDKENNGVLRPEQNSIESNVKGFRP